LFFLKCYTSSSNPSENTDREWLSCKAELKDGRENRTSEWEKYEADEK
jgi:hypothetical protein